MLYQVWSSIGHGLQPGPRFRLLDDAIRYTSSNATSASYAVRGPGGEWVHIQPRETDEMNAATAELSGESR